MPSELQMARSRRPVRIAFNLAFLDRRPLSGPGYYAVQMFDALAGIVAKSRPDLDLIAFARKDAREHFAPEGQECLNFIRSPRQRFGRVLWEQMVLPLVSRAHGVDLLFSPAFVSPTWGARWLVACIPDMYFAVIPDMIDARQRRYWRTMIPVTIGRCDRLITISDQTRRDVEAFDARAIGKTWVTRLASRLDLTIRGEAAGIAGPYILMVANLTANKNVEAVVKALSDVRQRGVPLRLIHVGADAESRLAAAAVASGVSEGVEGLGKVSDARLAGLYREAFAVVNASLYEGFGIPAVEAQAMGAPLVSSNAGALPEAAGEGALYFQPDQPERLANHLEQLWRDPLMRGQLIDKGHANAAQYSWSATAEATLRVFDDLIQSERSRK